jgi:hypothetical protein
LLEGAANFTYAAPSTFEEPLYRHVTPSSIAPVLSRIPESVLVAPAIVVKFPPA